MAERNQIGVSGDSEPDTAPAGPLADVSDDAFLGGKLQLLQPVKGYRAGMDAVLLAAADGPSRTPWRV